MKEENKFTAFFKAVWDKMKPFLKAVWDEMKENILSKWIGCFVGSAACLLTIILAITYSQASVDIYNGCVIAYAVVGAVLFILLSLFRQTSPLAPVLLMTFDFLCLVGLATSEGLVDYFSTQFFDGVSVAKFFQLPAADYLSIIFIILSLVLSSVSMYLPQNRKQKEDSDKPQNDNVVNETEKSAEEGAVK